jgi:glycosyltransferase 2 family protein
LNSRPAAAPAWRRIAGIAFVSTAFLFLAYIVGGNVTALRGHDWTIRPGLLLLSLALNIGGLIWGVGVWGSLLRRIGHDVRFSVLARIWFISGLGRYIPGKIWQFVGAAQMGVPAGLPVATTVTSLAAHTGFFLIAAFLVAVYLLPATAVGGIGGIALTALRWLAPLALLAVHPVIIGGALGIASRVARRDFGRWTGTWFDGIRLVVLASIGWMLTGSALYLFVLALTPIPATAVGAVVGMNAISFVAGYLVFFVPAGLGAKEGALAALLALYLPAPVAALLAIATRVWTVAAEVIPAAILLRLPRPTTTPASAPNDIDR